MSMADLWGNIKPNFFGPKVWYDWLIHGLHFVVSHTDNIQLDNVDSLAWQHCVLHPHRGWLLLVSRLSPSPLLIELLKCN